MEHRNELRAKVAPSNPSSKAASPSTSRIPSPQPPSRASSSDKLTSQFGTNGKVYMKNQDLPEWSGIPKKHSGSGVASPNLNMLGSGSSTPVTRGHSPAPGVPVRSKAIEIREAKAKKSKAGTVASGSDQDIARSEKVYPKSKETKVLEARIRALRGETATDNDVETLPEFIQCFCQGAYFSLDATVCLRPRSQKSSVIPLHTILRQLWPDPMSPPATTSAVSFV